MAVLIAGSVLLSGCGTGEQNVILTYKFNPDKIYHYKFDSRSKSTMFENDKVVHRGDKSLEILYTQETVSIIDGTKANVRFTYTSNNLEKPETWSNEFVMSSDGRVIGFGMQNDSSGQSLDYYRKLMEQAAPVYPDEPISPGFSWNNTVKVLLAEGNTDAATTYKLRAIVREAGYNCAVIEYKGTMYIPLSKGPGDAPDAKISGTDKIEVEGVSYFAYAEGIIIKEQETSHLLREGSILKSGKSINFRIEEDRKRQTILKEIEKKN